MRSSRVGMSPRSTLRRSSQPLRASSPADAAQVDSRDGLNGPDTKYPDDRRTASSIVAVHGVEEFLDESASKS